MKGHGYGKGAQHQLDVNDAHLQAATGKVPPTWSPERAKQYSLRQYERDLALWVASTDVDGARQGPLVALRLGGSAKVLAREMDVGVLTQGIMVPDGLGQGGQIAITGVAFIVRQLRRRFAPLDQEVQITAIAEVMHFKKWHSENTDDVLSRFELSINEGQNNGQVVFGATIKAWMVLSILGIPKKAWATILSPFQGALPIDDQQYAEFLGYVRRNGHLYENEKGLQQPYFMETTAGSGGVEQSYQSYPVTSGNHGWDIPGIGTASDFDDEEWSSGWSNNDEPIDNSEIANLESSVAGEQLYLGYRTAKRKFRHFTRKPGRSTSKGKSKGKGGHKGKPTYFWDDEKYAFEAIPVMQDYAFQKGAKEGKGSGPRRGNPIGPDGKVMTCSICKSEQHFQRFCPQNPKGKGKSSSTGYYAEPPVPTSSSSSTASTVHWSMQAGALPGYTGYFALPAAAKPKFSPMIEFDDGTSEPLHTTNENAIRQAAFHVTAAEAEEIAGPVNFTELSVNQQRLWQFPWWTSAYHTQVRLSTGQEGLLVDCGAMGDLCGDRWATRVQKIAEKHGQGVRWSKIPTIHVEGVGDKSSDINDQIIMPVCLEDGSLGEYTAIVAKDSDLPALYGLVRMTKQQAIIDTGNDRVIYPGPGGVKYTLSPGSKVLKCQRAISGHLLLPCAEWQNAKPNTSSSSKTASVGMF